MVANGVIFIKGTEKMEDKAPELMARRFQDSPEVASTIQKSAYDNCAVSLDHLHQT